MHTAKTNLQLFKKKYPTKSDPREIENQLTAKEKFKAFWKILLKDLPRRAPKQKHTRKKQKINCVDEACLSKEFHFSSSYIFRKRQTHEKSEYIQNDILLR